MAVNWGLAGPGFDPLQVLQTYGLAQQKAIEDRKRAAMLDAQAKVQSAFATGDLAGAASALASAGDYQGARAVSGIADDRRQESGRKAFGGFIRQQTQPAASPVQAAPASLAPSSAVGAVSPPGADPAAPDAGSPEDITVTAPRHETALADLAELGGPELVNAAMGFRKQMADLDAAKLKQVDAEAEAFGSLVPALQSMPPEQREAYVEQQRQYLNARGFDDQEIASLDLTDQGLATHLTQALGIKAASKMEQDERQFQARQSQQESHFQQSQATIRAGQAAVDRRARESNAIQAGTVGKQRRKTETDLRKEFENLPDVKAFRDTRAAYQQVNALAGRNDGQSDNALVYSYMKMLDPGSVVREGEFALAAKAAGTSERIANYFANVDKGTTLTPRMRREIANAAAQVYRQRRGTYDQTADRYRGYAADYGADPSRVAGKYTETAKRPVAAPAARPGVIQGDIGGLRYRVVKGR